MFSWSIEKPRPFPLNYGLSMYLLALLSFVCVVMMWILPSSVNEGKGSLYTDVENRMEKRRQEKLKAPLLENEVNWRVCSRHTRIKQTHEQAPRALVHLGEVEEDELVVEKQYGDRRTQDAEGHEITLRHALSTLDAHLLPYPMMPQWWSNLQNSMIKHHYPSKHTPHTEQ